MTIHETIVRHGFTFKLKDEPFGGWIGVYCAGRCLQAFKSLPECRQFIADNARIWAAMKTPTNP